MTSQLVLIILGSFSLGLLWGLALQRYFSIKSNPKTPPTRAIGDGLPPMESLDPPVEEMKPLAEFPIAGKPRRVPWAVKRREIEQQHRTKRKRMEEWT